MNNRQLHIPGMEPVNRNQRCHWRDRARQRQVRVWSHRFDKRRPARNHARARRG
jgi:hypothetical protein